MLNLNLECTDDLIKELENLVGKQPERAKSKEVIRCDIEFIPFDLQKNVPSYYRAFTPDIPEFYRNVQVFPEVCHKTAYDAFKGFCQLLLAAKYPFKAIELTHQAQARLGLANIDLIGSAIGISDAGNNLMLEAYLSSRRGEVL